MATYTDAKKREWNIVLNIGLCKKIKSELQFDFLKVEKDTNALLDLSKDNYLLIDVLHLLCETQMRERGVSVDDFVESFQGDAIDSAINAISEAYVNFFPNPQRRQILSKMWAKAREAEAIVLNNAEAEISKATYGN